MSTILIQAVSPLMVGEGTAVGGIKLVLARERHTRWPFIPGTALKGALRARATMLTHAEHQGLDPDRVIDVFGAPPPSGADDDIERPGSLVFNQATLLALPLRSLKGGYLLVTSPLALARLARELREEREIPRVDEDRVIVAPGQSQRYSFNEQNLALDERTTGIVMLEDLDWLLTEDPRINAWIEVLSNWSDDVPWERLALVNDALFDHACAAWTSVRTRAAIGEDGIVKDGQLFTQESLPPETLLWTTLDTSLQPKEHLDTATLLPRQGRAWTMGAHQTTGAGRVAWYAMEVT